VLKNLEMARNAAKSVRYSNDAELPSTVIFGSRTAITRDLSYRDGLEITGKTLPAIERGLIRVCGKLQISRLAVLAFVYASPEVQAECLCTSEDGCLIRFSSALIELLDENEFSFVAGHEIGHFLLNHHHRTLDSADTIISLKIKRSQEISADRIGLLACGSIETAMRAIIKTASGLSSRHLRFNVSEYVGQLNKISDKNITSESGRTHPSLAQRGRALLWFSMTSAFTSQSGEDFSRELATVDARISKDLFRDVDALLGASLLSLQKDLSLWISAREIVKSGSFSKSRQEAMVKLFDRQTVDSLKEYLRQLSQATAMELIESKISIVKNEIEKYEELHVDNRTG
jgi:hypothetical protein